MSEEKKPIPPINITRVKLSEHVQVRRTVYANEGTPPDELSNPEYWRHVAKDFRPCDELVIWCEDMSWRAEAVILSAGPVSARVAVTKLDNFDDAKASIVSDGVSVEWAGPHHKFRVTHKGEVIQAGFDTRSAAEESAINYRKTVLKAA